MIYKYSEQESQFDLQGVRKYMLLLLVVVTNLHFQQDFLDQAT